MAADLVTILATIGLIFAVMLAGILVERVYRGFAARNPALGPFRKSGCGACSCRGEQAGGCGR